MDGFRVLAARHHRGWQDIPVIVLTAADLSESEHERLNGGVERVLRKIAVSRDQLREWASRYVGHA